MHHSDITAVIIEVSIDIHRRLGPGLLESVYRRILAHELGKRGFQVQMEQPIPVLWDSLQLDIGFRADLIINNLVIVETKSVEAIHPVHKKQLLTYLRLTDMRVGLLINFNVELLRNGISRVVNNLEE